MADTIYAPASGSGKAAVAVIRISGPLAHEVIVEMTGRPLAPVRMLARRNLLDSEGGRIDEALVVIFSDKASFTGETSAEIQCHGGPAVISGVLDRLSQIQDCRLALPGEFTRRALMNGKLDLTQAEALGDLINAETLLQRGAALSAMGGSLSAQSEAWRERLIHSRALLEVTIDWADEEVPEDVSPDVREALDQLSQEFRVELVRSKRYESLRNGFYVAIVGAPNSGKSTLLNAIAGRDVAIVTDVPGTTRDVLEVKTDLQGLPVVFVDTAGLRDSDDLVEAEGIKRAQNRAKSADLRIFLRPPIDPGAAGLDELWVEGDLQVLSKADLGDGPERLKIAAREGTGVKALMIAVREILAEGLTETAGLGHARQKETLSACLGAVERSIKNLDNGDMDLAAEDLRVAISTLDRLTGRLQMEDVLDKVFGSFCLGK